MGNIQQGSVVLIEFPFSDLSGVKLRPALVLANVDFGDLILCQITSKAYSSKRALKIGENTFKEGSIALESFVRCDKLFTADPKIINQHLGLLNDRTFLDIQKTVRSIFSS